MQSWGIQSRFSDRDTGRDPSRSGVVGLLCCALGLPRDSSLEAFSSIQMTTRVDREGVFATDFQTSLNVAKANETRGDTVISRKHYLADASFTVGLSGDALLLKKAHSALKDPVWPLFLGRKAFVPSVPPYLPEGFFPDESNSFELLKSFPGEAFKNSVPEGEGIRFVVEDPEGSEVRNDFPVSFCPRIFIPRKVKTLFIRL